MPTPSSAALITFAGLLVCVAPTASATDPDKAIPWRQTTCLLSGSGDAVVLTISFQNRSDKSSNGARRELKLTTKTLSATTELGTATIPWRQMGAINTTRVSLEQPDSDFLLEVALPANVIPAGDPFGIIDPKCDDAYRAFAIDIMNRMDKGTL